MHSASLGQVEERVMNRGIYNAMPVWCCTTRPVREILHDDEGLFDGAEVIIVHAVAPGEHSRDKARDERNEDQGKDRTIVPETFEGVQCHFK